MDVGWYVEVVYCDELYGLIIGERVVFGVYDDLGYCFVYGLDECFDEGFVVFVV